MIIVDAGVPGTGKTAIARVLVEDLGCSHYSSSRLLRVLGYTSPDPTGRFTELASTSGIEDASRLLASKSREGSCIILETLYPAAWLERLPEEEVAFIILLRCHPKELLRRLKTKNWPLEKIYENVLAEAFNVVAEELLAWDHSVFEIDTTGRSPQESVDELYRLLSSWSPGISIDWMSYEEVQVLVTKLSLSIDFDKYRLGV